MGVVNTTILYDNNFDCTKATADARAVQGSATFSGELADLPP